MKSRGGEKKYRSGRLAASASGLRIRYVFSVNFGIYRKLFGSFTYFLPLMSFSYFSIIFLTI